MSARRPSISKMYLGKTRIKFRYMTAVLKSWWLGALRDTMAPCLHVSWLCLRAVLCAPVFYVLQLLKIDGQTGSGKTHSIMGTAGVDEEEGIIPRAIKDVFRTLRVDKASTLSSANVRVSMLEIYNDDVKDLLHPDIPSRDIMIREDKDGRIFFTGAREEAVQDVRTAMLYLEQGNLNRSTAETLMNLTSSRSHVRRLLIIYLC